MLTCYYGTPWLNHFKPPIGNGKGCAACDGQLSLPWMPDAVIALTAQDAGGVGYPVVP